MIEDDTHILMTEDELEAFPFHPQAPFYTPGRRWRTKEPLIGEARKWYIGEYPREGTQDGVIKILWREVLLA